MSMTIADFEVGQKVAVEAHSDAFMRGVRYGRVVKVGRRYVHVVSMGAVRAQVRVRPHELRITAPTLCSVTRCAPGHPHDALRCRLSWDHAEPCSFGKHRANTPVVTDVDLRIPAHRVT